jgi:hypothetical protein
MLLEVSTGVIEAQYQHSLERCIRWRGDPLKLVGIRCYRRLGRLHCKNCQVPRVELPAVCETSHHLYL